MSRSRIAATLVLLPVLSFVTSCGDEEPEADDAPAESSSAGGFTVTRPDGSTFEVDGPFTVECLESDETDGVTLVRGSTTYYTGGPVGSAGAYLEFDPATIGDEGRTYDLPIEGGEEVDDSTVFFYDNPTGDEDERNELSGNTEDSSGTVRVVTATCDPVPRLVVEVEATIGSEYGDRDAVDVVGGLDLTGP